MGGIKRPGAIAINGESINGIANQGKAFGITRVRVDCGEGSAQRSAVV